MQQLEQTISRLQEICQQLKRDHYKDVSGRLEKEVRDLTRRALGRSDLRLTVEILINDIYSGFLGYSTLDESSREMIVEDSLQKIERLEMMTQTDQAIKEEATVLPPPPDYAVRAVEKEQKIIQAEQDEAAKAEELRRRKRERKEMEEQRERQAEQASQREQENQERQRKLQQEQKERQSRQKKPEPAPRQEPRQPREERKAPPREPRPKREPRQRREQPEQNKQPAREPRPKRPQVQASGNLDQPIESLPGVGSVIARKFETKGVTTLADLLRFYPRDYEDRRSIVTVDKLRAGTWCTVVAKVERISVKHPPGRKGGITVVRLSDSTGTAFAKFFGGRVGAIKSNFPVGKQVLISGDVEAYRDTLEFHHPEADVLQKGETPEGKIVPVYSETEGLTRRRILSFVQKIYEMYADKLTDCLPESIRNNQKLPEIRQALEQVHFPPPDSDFDLLKIQATEGHKRFVFEELFLLQLGVSLRRNYRLGQKGIAFSGATEKLKDLIKELPFKLTEGQKKAVNQIVTDMKKPVPANRLIQGDVGSGKTVVALFGALAALADGYQVAMMAPTEVLARQHHNTIVPMLEKFGFKAELLTGKGDKSANDEIRAALAENKSAMVIGTHALIQGTTAFDKLGLVIIDEQHRFGVAQRRRLVQKGGDLVPDLITLTATPIPRTLAQTAYGDLDVSVITDKPQGRKPVKTTVLDEAHRDRAFARVRQLLLEGRQGFIVYPLVEQSDRRELQDATTQAEKLASDLFKDFKVGLLTGRMKSEEKEKIVDAFHEKKLDLLVATTVIEVGIDVPNAGIIVIEHAERFGLAQLHQLRGRVGRSDFPGECFLIACGEGGEAKQRLATLESTDDGLILAEKDLELRGQGDLLGTRQHGMPALRLADLSRDAALLEAAREEVAKLLEKDPKLEAPEAAETRKALESLWKRKVDAGLMDD